MNARECCYLIQLKNTKDFLQRNTTADDNSKRQNVIKIEVIDSEIDIQMFS